MMQLNSVLVKINYYSIFFIIWPNHQVGKMKQIVCSRLGFPALVPQEKVLFL